MRLSFLDPGRLTARIELERRVNISDGQGGAAESWEPAASLWGLIEPGAVREGEEAGRRNAVLTHKVTLRMRPDVERGMRLVWRGRFLLIRSVHEPNMRGAYLVCHCEEEMP